VQSNSFGYSGPHVKIQNPRTTPSGRKVNDSERKKKKKNNAINSGHLRLPRSPSTMPDGQFTHFARTNISVNNNICSANEANTSNTVMVLKGSHPPKKILWYSMHFITLIHVHLIGEHSEKSMIFLKMKFFLDL
jgi:hypothetical protein